MKKLYSSLCRDVFSPELNSETLKTNFGHASGLSRSFINDPLFLVLGVKQELCEGIEKLLDSGEQKSCGNDIPETAPDELSVFNPVNMRRASGESPINPEVTPAGALLWQSVLSGSFNRNIYDCTREFRLGEMYTGSDAFLYPLMLDQVISGWTGDVLGRLLRDGNAGIIASSGGEVFRRLAGGYLADHLFECGVYSFSAGDRISEVPELRKYLARLLINRIGLAVSVFMFESGGTSSGENDICERPAGKPAVAVPDEKTDTESVLSVAGDKPGRRDMIRTSLRLPELMKSLRIMDDLLDVEIAASKFDGAVYEIAVNLMRHNVSLNQTVKYLLFSQTVNVKNKQRAVKNNLKDYFDVTNIDVRNMLDFGDECKGRGSQCTNRDKISGNQLAELEKMKKSATYYIGLVLLLFSEAEVLVSSPGKYRSLLNSSGFRLIREFKRLMEGDPAGASALFEKLFNEESPADISFQGELSCGDSGSGTLHKKCRNRMVKFRVMEYSFLDPRTEGVVFRITSSPRVEVVYLALMTALSTVKPREKLMLLFEKDLQKILRDFYSGRMVMLLQWCYPYRRKEKAPDRTE